MRACVNVLSTRARPAAPMRARNAGSASSRLSAAASAAVEIAFFPNLYGMTDEAVLREQKRQLATQTLVASSRMLKL